MRIANHCRYRDWAPASAGEAPLSATHLLIASSSALARYHAMPTIDTLRRDMETAAAAEDFALAARLRDQISILRGQTTDADIAPIDPTGLTRQQPGKMGIGTSRQRYAPPPGWTPPVKPDPMTRGRKRKG